MRRIQWLAIAPLCLLTSCVIVRIPSQQVPQPSPRVEESQPSTPTSLPSPPIPSTQNSETDVNGKDFSELEAGIIEQTNLARANPSAYADKIAKWQPYFDGNVLRLPGEIPLRTNEGVSAVEEAVAVLKATDPVPTLSFADGLSLAAADHVKDQSADGKTGHDGTDGSSPSDRVSRYGEWQKTLGENISYGPDTAEKVVMSLIVDDGVSDRGHRENIFNPDFRVMGVACGEHAEYRVMCVMEYAGGFRE